MTAKWWPEALMYASAVINRTPMERLGKKSPHEALYGKKPDGLPIHTWGSTCYAHTPKQKRSDNKLSDRALECQLLGLAQDYKGYRLLDVKNNKYLIARDVRFEVTDTDNLIDVSFPKLAQSPLSESEKDDTQGLGKRGREEANSSIFQPAQTTTVKGSKFTGRK